MVRKHSAKPSIGTRVEKVWETLHYTNTVHKAYLNTVLFGAANSNSKELDLFAELELETQNFVGLELENI